ncbi:MAG: restriction endonuclease, partial [Burkholderiaceae bacterium]
MAQNYFNSDHFKLLNKWKGTVYDKTNPEQQRVYEELGQAYDVTKHWAEALQQQLFKDGRTKTVRKPADRSGKFTAYNWARIYPSKNSPEELAYTVGISADSGFFVDMDLIDVKVKNPSLRKEFEKIRGSNTPSPIGATKTASEGLSMDFAELVNWSADAIKNYKISYDDVADQLGLSA